MELEVIDTYPRFLEIWKCAQQKSIEQQIERWLRDYMSLWPELLEKQVNDYEQTGQDWQTVAAERVFPFLADWLESMSSARSYLLQFVQDAALRAEKLLGEPFPITFVIYVGIGSAAGWATTFGGQPAVLFGLEKIAEMQWSKKEMIRGLAAHEVGHLLHTFWREQAGSGPKTGSIADLYSEGFAQRIEEKLNGEKHWYEEAYQPGWLNWCKRNRGWLASEYLSAVDSGEPVNSFFGDWYKIKGYSQCGYFLGFECIHTLEKSLDLLTIATLPLEDINIRVRQVLQDMATGKIAQYSDNQSE